MRISIFLACVTLLGGSWGCGGANNDKSTGTTFWDLGAQFSEHDLSGVDLSGADMAEGPLFPLTLTPLTTPQVSTANISLYFQVTDARGDGVANLMTSQFTYTEDGTTPDPTESGFTVMPLEGNLYIPTVLVLDVSGSVASKLGDIQAAAKAIVTNMLSEQQMAIMVFADTPKVVQGFTANQTVLNSAIDNIASANVGVSTNLYGAGVSAVGMWTDGFQNDPSMTKLTTGLAIILTDGADDAAASTLQAYVSARANKRVITVGIGSMIDVSVLKEMQTAGFIQETSYAALTSDIKKVTDVIETLAHSIYSANYCSPKRGNAGGTNSHELVFTVTGNPLTDINATCTNATFPASAPSTCASLMDQTHTQACEVVGSNVTCCPFDAPFYCSGLDNCYATAAEAQADCSTSCILCGGDGTGKTTNNGDQAGPAIHVTFDSSNYKSTQCPAFWGTNCKALQTCCPSVVPQTEETSCVTALNNAAGDETTCMTNISTYCPTTVDSSCMAAATCCGTYPSNSPAQTSCQEAVFQKHGTNCNTPAPGLVQEYCPSPSPTPQPCNDLQKCCLGLNGSYGQLSCVEAMVNDAAFNPAVQCANSKTQYCPTTTHCTALQACCDQFGQTEQTQCYSQLASNSNNDIGCMSSMTQYCPTTTNCVKLQACCQGKPTTSTGSGTTRDQCEQQLVNAFNNDNTCMTDLTNQGC
jgi:uncharacterized protein YegL